MLARSRFTRAASLVRSKFVSTLAIGAAAVAVATVPQITAAPEAAAQTCPAVTVVAARGSGQENSGAAWYANGAPAASNGWEGATIAAFLRTSESRYAATHNGASLMNSVGVLGLDPQHYPATFPAYDIPNVATPTTMAQVTSLIAAYASPVLNTAVSAANQFTYSVKTGRAGVLTAIADYEMSTGCHPKYILTGYSQGAMILGDNEKVLSQAGKLAGVVYMGNPNTARGDRSTVGNAAGIGGILGIAPTNTLATAGTPNRVNYCLPLDGVCDISPATLQASRGNGGNHGRYFVAPSEWDAQVADSFGRFVDQVRY